jgi:hypothetical protein
MRVVEELKAGRWPAATVGNTYAELVVDHNGKQHTLTALDYPGEVFRKAFMNDSDDPDAVELVAAVDRALAVIFLIDPAVVSAGGEEAQEDAFGLTQAAARIRSQPGGANVPIAVVFTKCDVNAAFIKEAGGSRKFAQKHFGQMFRSVERASVFPCAAVRVTQNALGKVVPRADRPPENVVEPLRYCFEMIEEGGDRERIRSAQAAREEAEFMAVRAEENERKKSAVAWMVFAVAVTLLLVAVAVVTYKFAFKQQ